MPTRLSSLIAIVSGLLLASSTVLQGQVTDVYRSLLTSRGLGHLSDSDMAKVEELVASMNKASTTIYRENAEAFESVEGYLRNAGFEKEQVYVVRRDDRDALVVGKLFPDYTFDVPYGLSTLGLRNGIHLVRKSYRGISAIIADGEVHEFVAARWQPLPRR